MSEMTMVALCSTCGAFTAISTGKAADVLRDAQSWAKQKRPVKTIDLSELSRDAFCKARGHHGPMQPQLSEAK